ncbi:MAG: VanW family protein [Actinomycetota bacterium]|nr:VanW family protein [Actinomycetota bacterium]
MKEISRQGGPRAVRRSDRRNAAAAKRKSRGSRYARRRGLALVALAICVLLAGFVALDALLGGDEIQRGVSVGSVEVGGMTPEEARRVVERDAAATFEKITFGTGEEGFTLSGEELGVRSNAAAAVDEAYAIGRRGNVLQRLSEVSRAYLGGVRVDLEAGYDERAAASALDRAAAEFDREPQNASFIVTDAGKVEVKEAREGRVLDREGTLANLDRALESMSGRVPLAEGPAPKPEVTTAEVQKYKPEEVIGEYQTDFLWDSNPNRKLNMKLAAGAVNNTVLAPGEVFSFIEHTASLDYKEAKTFSDGGVGIANGGGLCQVSSTLYMAASYAGLEIVERNPHYAVLPYIKPGFDATVWFGDEYGYGVQDMKFKNNTGGYILIREWVDERGFLNAQILGQPTGKKVEMRTVKIFEDTTRGIKWVTYKKVTKDGKVLRDGYLYEYTYSYNPPPPDDAPHYETSAPRVAGWSDPGNTTGWAEVPE